MGLFVRSDSEGEAFLKEGKLIRGKSLLDPYTRPEVYHTVTKVKEHGMISIRRPSKRQIL